MQILTKTLDSDILLETSNISKNFYVYCHIRPDTNKIFYIGKGQNKRAWKTYGRNRHWKNVVNKSGGFITKLLIENITEPSAFVFEKIFIRLIGRENLCNLTDGGEGPSGWKATEEYCLKMSLDRTGKKLSDGHRSKISQGRKGMKFSKTHRFNISKSKIDKKLSNQHIQKISKSKIGKFPKRRPVYQFDIEGKLIKKYFSISDASRQTNVKHQNISSAIRGKIKTAGGFIWKN